MVFVAEANMCRFFNRLKCVLPLEIQLSREDVWIQLTDLTPPHLCACSSCLCRGFLCSVKNKMRGDCFVDIGVIDDHHCLNFLFIPHEYIFSSHILGIAITWRLSSSSVNL